MLHAMMLEVTDGKLFYAPIGDYPQKILDLGTGTGIWAIEGMIQSSCSCCTVTGAGQRDDAGAAIWQCPCIPSGAAPSADTLTDLYCAQLVTSTRAPR